MSNGASADTAPAILEQSLPRRVPLTYKAFAIIPTEAVKEAYLLNLVQTVGRSDRLAAGEILADYAIGDMTFAEAEAELEKWVLEETTPTA